MTVFKISYSWKKKFLIQSRWLNKGIRVILYNIRARTNASRRIIRWKKKKNLKNLLISEMLTSAPFGWNILALLRWNVNGDEGRNKKIYVERFISIGTESVGRKFVF